MRVVGAAGGLYYRGDLARVHHRGASEHLGADAPELRQIALPDDPLPAADAIVGIGHPINYLPDARSIDRA